MTSAKLATDGGSTFYLGSDYGSWFDMDPLTQLEAKITSAQLYQQQGEMVSGAAVGGISRTISGCFLGTDARTKAASLVKALAPGATGRFTIGKSYADFYVEKSPELTFKSHDFINFDFMLFFPDPYWYNVSSSIKTITGSGTVYNNGHADTHFTLTLTATAACSSMRVTIAATGEKLEVTGSYAAGDTVTAAWADGMLTITDGDGANVFGSLSDDSTLLALHPGANAVTVSDSTTAKFTFNIAYLAALPED